MSTILFIGVVFLLIAVVIGVMKKGNIGKPTHPIYVAKKGFMTPSERTLFLSLKMAFPEHYVFAQVRLADLVDVHPKLKGKEWSRYFNPIAKKSIDFLLCGKDMNVIAAIELDDPTHKQERRIKADNQKNDALKDAGIRIERITGRIPKPSELQSLIQVKSSQ